MSPRSSRVAYGLLVAVLAAFTVVSVVALLGGPDPLGDAHAVALGLIFLGIAAVQLRDEDGDRRNARVLGGCAAVLIVSGLVQLAT